MARYGDGGNVRPDMRRIESPEASLVDDLAPLFIVIAKKIRAIERASTEGLGGVARKAFFHVVADQDLPHLRVEPADNVLRNGSGRKQAPPLTGFEPRYGFGHSR